MMNIEQDLEPHPYLHYEVKNVREDTYDGRPVIKVDLYDSSGYREYTNQLYDRVTGVMVGNETRDDGWRLRPKSETRPINHFFLFAGQREWDKSAWIKLPHEDHPTGPVAAEKAKSHNGLCTSTLSPFRFMVKKEVELSPVRDYENWAAFRFESGEWKQVPWADEPWAKASNQHHFAHLSKADEFKVAFWDTEGCAQNDAISIMNPGRYLKQYFGDVLSETQIRDWAVKVDVECELKITLDEEEIYRIYSEEGAPSSCMRYKDENTCHDSIRWRGGQNPVRVYAAGDLGIAYLERKGKIVARALVWPERKIAGRRYGDIERLTDALNAAGYTIDSRDSSMSGRGSGGLNGAKILKREVEGFPGVFVGPYIDAGYQVVDKGEHFEMIHSSSGVGIPSTMTCGLFGTPNLTSDVLRALDAKWRGEHFTVPAFLTDPSVPCPVAIDEDDEEHDYYCDADNCGVGMSDDDRWNLGDETFCHSCYQDRTFTCDHCDCREDRNGMRIVDGENWCEDCWDDSGMTCEVCHEGTSSTRTVNGIEWCNGCVTNSDVGVTTCDYCEDGFTSDNLTTVADARYDEVGDENHHADACNSCVDGNDDIQRDVNDVWIDISTATNCDDCGSYFSSALSDEECPTCTAEQEPTGSNQEMEPA